MQIRSFRPAGEHPLHHLLVVGLVGHLVLEGHFQAETYGDTALKVALENQVADETNHKQMVERMLSGWPE